MYLVLLFVNLLKGRGNHQTHLAQIPETALSTVFFLVTFISDGGKPAICDFIFSGLIEELGVHVTTEGDHTMLIFMETSEASSAFPLTQNSKRKKKERDQHWLWFVRI